MGKPYNERRRTLNLAAYRLRTEGRTNKEIAEQIGVGIEQVPGMALAGLRIAQMMPPTCGAEDLAVNSAPDSVAPSSEKGGRIDRPPPNSSET